VTAAEPPQRAQLLHVVAGPRQAGRAGAIGGAALDVTDPEPLPDDHSLWELPDVLITPHVATPPDAERRHFAARVRENVRRLAAGEALEGRIDPDGGY